MGRVGNLPVMLQLPAHGWKPRHYQMPAWTALSKGCRLAVLAWHRRAGKDDVALHNAAVKSMQRVGNYWHMLPLQEQARRAIWDSVNPRTGRKRWEDAFPAEIIEHVDNQAMKLTLKTKSTWQLLGSDNYNSLVGSTPVGITMSEAALADPNAFGFFRPILLENDGWSVHISSVRGRNHFYRLFKAHEHNPKAFVQLLSAETSGAFTRDQLEQERRDLIAEHGATVGAMLFEQEYLSLWDASNLGAVFGSEMRDMKRDGRCVPLIYDPRFPVDTSWDIGVGDPTVILFWQQIGNLFHLIDWYSSTDTGLEHYAEVLASKKYMYGHHIGPHDIVNRSGGHASSWYELGRKLGIHFKPQPNPSLQSKIGSGARLLRMTMINMQPAPPQDPMDDCAFIADALDQYHFTYDRERGVMSRNPVHDWSSHYASAMMTYGQFVDTLGGRAMRAQPVQGLEGQELNTMRLRSILANNQNKRGVRGAFG